MGSMGDATTGVLKTIDWEVVKMTQRARLMGWNRVLETDWSVGRFTFPKRILRSVRFGAHACEVGATMQILPVKMGEPVAMSQPSRRADTQGRSLAMGSRYWMNAGTWLTV